MTKGSRIVWIDQLRAVAFLLVIIGHTYVNADVKSVIYSFHMPLFFMISGLTINREKVLNTPFKDLAAKYFKRLVIPYVWMNFIAYPIFIATYNIMLKNDYSLLSVLESVLISNGSMIFSTTNAMWFVTSLFLSLIIVCAFIKLTKGSYPLCLALSALSVCFGLESRGVHMPWHLNVSLVAVGYLFIGFSFMQIYKKNRERFDGLKPLPRIFYIILLSALGYYLNTLNGRVSMTVNKYGRSYVLSLVVSLCFCAVSFLAVSVLPNIKILSYIGQNTLLYLGIHIPIIRFLYYYAPSLFAKEYYNYILSVVLFFGLALVCLAVNKICPWINGRPLTENTRLSVFWQIAVTAFCLAAPIYYIVTPVVGLGKSAISLLIVAIVTVVLSAVFVTVANRRFPIVFLKEKTLNRTV